MAKITNIRERVHQPLRDALIRTSGNYVSNVQDRTDLFTVAGGDQGRTNLQNGSTLPSDQSMVVLALRTFLWFRNPQLRAEDAAGNVTVNGDLLAADFVANQSTAIGSAEDVHRLYFQASEQLLWSVGAGQKYSLTSMPSAYFPYGGGLHGRLPKASGGCCTTSSYIPSDRSKINATAVVTVSGGSCCPGTNIFIGISATLDGWEIGTYTGTPDGESGPVDNETVASLPATVSLSVEKDGPKCITLTVSELTSLYPPKPPYAAVNVFSGAGNSGCATLIHWNNGTPEASSLTRLARAILIPPRQNILVSAQIVSYADNPQSSVATQGSRNLLSLTSNLNQQDYINKIITMTLDGLLSRDVQ